MTILVSGASGFVGSNLVSHFAHKGVRVVGIVRSGAEKCNRNNPSHVLMREIQGPTSQSELFEIVSEFQPSLVFHAATKFIASHHPEQIPDLISSNILFGTQLLEALKMAGAKSHFVNIQSAWQHFGGQFHNATSLYSATKNAFDEIINFYVKSSAVTSVNAVLFDTYGLNDSREKVLDLLIESALTSEPLEMSNGNQLINLTHISDVCKALDIISRSYTNQETLEISSEHTMSIQELSKIVEASIGAPANCIWGARDSRLFEMYSKWEIGPLPKLWIPESELVLEIRKIAEQKALKIARI